MRILQIISMILLGFTAIGAQEKLQFFGYFESTLMGTVVNNREHQLHTTKLRIDLQSNISDKIFFAANFDYITYHGNTNWNILDFLSRNIVSAIPENIRKFYVIPFSDRQFLDNAYIKIMFKKFDLIAGKQQISLGTGYVWNPLDIFNIKDPLDPTYEQPGHNAIRLDVPLASGYSLTALYSPDDNWRHSAKLVRFKGNVSRFDYSLIAGETVWRFHDYQRFDYLRMNFLELTRQRRLLGGSLVGELLGLGVWAEYGYNEMKNDQDFYELVVGADYTFDFQTYIMAEFYRSTLGKSDYKNYTLNDWLRQFAAEQKAISRDQVYVFLQHPVTDFINLGTSCIYSISDNSVAMIPTLNYSFAANMDIMAYLNFNFGKEGKAYSKSVGSSGLLRARVYF